MSDTQPSPEVLLYLNSSKARRRIKDELGNANHLLVTILVGLHAVETELVKDAPVELRAAWNPKNKIASARRSRIMVLQMALVRTTDAFDAYIGSCVRKPSLIQDQELRRSLHKAGRSVFSKLKLIKKHFPNLHPTICALVEVMIVWRNRLVHLLNDEKVSSESWALLESNKVWLKSTFRGMEFERLLHDFEDDVPPTFKETASFIRATHKLIEQLDQILITNLDVDRFFRDFVWNILGRGPKTSEENRRALSQSIWGKDIATRRTKVRSLFVNNGLSDIKSDPQAAQFPPELFSKIVSYSPKALLEFLRPEQEELDLVE